MKQVAHIQRVLLLYIKALNSFFTPPLNVHFRLRISITILLYLPTCCPATRMVLAFLYPCSGFSKSNHDSVPDCIFLFIAPFIGASSAFPSPPWASHCPVNPGHVLMSLFAQRSNFIPKSLNSAMPSAKEEWDMPACL